MPSRILPILTNKKPLDLITPLYPCSVIYGIWRDILKCSVLSHFL